MVEANMNCEIVFPVEWRFDSKLIGSAGSEKSNRLRN